MDSLYKRIAAHHAFGAALEAKPSELAAELREMADDECPQDRADIFRMAADYLEAPQPARSASAMVIDEIAAERRRQIAVEGWTAEHDDEHIRGEMALAAACYAMWSFPFNEAHKIVAWLWPWESKWFKPKNVRRDLIRAAALIIAEIERLDRLSPSETAP